MADPIQSEPQSSVFVPESFKPARDTQGQEAEKKIPEGPVELEVQETEHEQPETVPDISSSMEKTEYQPTKPDRKIFKKGVKSKKIPQIRDKLTIKIEKIMEEGIEDAFNELTPIQKQEFKIKGEETALEIRSLLQSTRVKVKQIFLALFEWLKILPGINKFFLEQEAKIKADKIIALKKSR